MEGMRMILKDKQCKDFEEAMRPLIKYMNENFHPHTKIVIDSGRAELYESVNCFRTIDYIKD